MEDKPMDDNQSPASQPPAAPPTPPEAPPTPPEEHGHVDNEAAMDDKSEVSDNSPAAPKEPGPQSMDAESAGKTVAELDKSHEGDLESSVNEPKVSEAPGDSKAAPPKKANTAVFAIVVAVLVALLLVGIGYAAWLASRDDNGQNDTQQTDTTTETTDSTTPVDTQEADQLDGDVDQLNSDLDNLQKQIDDNSLEDSNIGL